MTKPPQKLLIWLGNSLDAVKSFIDLANKRYRDLLTERMKK
ncbi:MAG: hypothetical protein Q8O52_17690 [Sulfuritalea sp.]|nr:hypothetical protein [Sulfuritalea sp.]